MHAHGPGLAALLGAPVETQELVDAYDERVHADESPRVRRRLRSPTSSTRWRGRGAGRRRLGVDGVARSVRDRAAIRVVDGRVLPTVAVRDISAQRHAEDERADAVRRLQWPSSVDALTELFNRRHFPRCARPPRRLRRRGGDRARRRRPLQAHQRHAGPSDRRRRAARDRTPAQDATRPCDVTSRWGGEEFCELLDETATTTSSRRSWSGCGHGRRLLDPGRRKRRRRSRPRSAGATVCRMSHAEQLLATRMRRSTLLSAAAATRHDRRRCTVACARRRERGPRGRGPGALAAAASARGGIGPMHAAQVAALSMAVALELEPPAVTVEPRGWANGCTIAARHRADRHPRPPRPARRPGARPHAPSRDRRRGARERRPGPEQRGADRAQPSRALRRHGVSGRPGRGADPSRGPHRGGGRRLRGDDREPPLRGPARAPRRDRRAAEQCGRPVRPARRGCARRRARPRAPGRRARAS